jgi:hypothetical protein
MGALDQEMDGIFSVRDRENMQPTIEAFQELLREHPNNPRLVYEVGGSYVDPRQRRIHRQSRRRLTGRQKRNNRPSSASPNPADADQLTAEF